MAHTSEHLHQGNPIHKLP